MVRVLVVVTFVAALALSGCNPRLRYANEGAVAASVASRDLGCTVEDVDMTFVGTHRVFDVDVGDYVDGPVYRVVACEHERIYECRLVWRARNRRSLTDNAPTCWAEGTAVVLAR